MLKKNQEILCQIRQADETLLQEIMDEISARYKRAYPQWEVYYIAVPRNDRKALEDTLSWIWKHSATDGKI
jgi:hypothetical protein